MERRKIDVNDLEKFLEKEELIYLDNGVLRQNRPTFNILNNSLFSNKYHITETVAHEFEKYFQNNPAERELFAKLKKVSPHYFSEVYGTNAGKIGNYLLTYLTSIKKIKEKGRILKESEKIMERKYLKHLLGEIIGNLSIFIMGDLYHPFKKKVLKRYIEKNTSKKLKIYKKIISPEEIYKNGINQKERNFIKRNYQELIDEIYQENKDGNINFNEENIFNNNDEKTISTALIHCLYSQKRTSIISYDKDFIHPIKIESLKSLESNKGYPFSIYRVNQNNQEIDIYSFKFNNEINNFLKIIDEKNIRKKEYFPESSSREELISALETGSLTTLLTGSTFYVYTAIPGIIKTFSQNPDYYERFKIGLSDLPIPIRIIALTTLLGGLLSPPLFIAEYFNKTKRYFNEFLKFTQAKNIKNQ